MDIKIKQRLNFPKKKKQVAQGLSVFTIKLDMLPRPYMTKSYDELLYLIDFLYILLGVSI